MMKYAFLLLFLLVSNSAVAQEQEGLDEALFNVEFLGAEITELERQAKASESESEKEELFERAQDVRDERRLEFASLSSTFAKSLTEEQRSEITKAIVEDLKVINKRFLAKKKEVADARKAMEKASQEEVETLEDEFDSARKQKTDLLAIEWKNITYLAQFDEIDAEGFRADFQKELAEESRTVASTLSTLLEKRRKTKKRATANEDEKGAKSSDLTRIQDRIDRAVAELRILIGLLKETDQDATKYQQLLIESTGTVTADILDKEVSVGLIEKWLKQAKEDIATKAPGYVFKFVWFLLILLLARIASVIVGALTKRWFKRSNLSHLASEFMHKSAAKIVFWIGVLFGLSQLGFDVTALIAGFGVAGLVIGFALQDTLSNFASGLMILFYQPFDTGDLIRAADVEGVVDKMTLVSTEILTLDNQRFIIPNNKVWQNVIQNVTAEKTRRVDFLFGVGYSDDLKHAENVLTDLVSTNEHVLEEPTPIVQVHELADSSVNFVVRMWVETDAYWDAYWSITRSVKDRFDAEGISIPFPQRDVHMYAQPPAGDSTDSSS